MGFVKIAKGAGSRCWRAIRECHPVEPLRRADRDLVADASRLVRGPHTINQRCPEIGGEGGFVIELPGEGELLFARELPRQCPAAPFWRSVEDIDFPLQRDQCP